MDRAEYAFPARGMNKAIPVDRMPPEFCADLVDFVQGYRDEWYVRGGVDTAANISVVAGSSYGLGAAYSSGGTLRLIAFGNFGGPVFYVLEPTSGAGNAVTAPVTTAGTVLSCIRPALGGGVMAAVSADYANGNGSASFQRCMRWRGAIKATLSGNQITAAMGTPHVTNGGVTADFRTVIEPGMFLIRTSAGDGSPVYIGTVAAVTGALTLELEKQALGNVVNGVDNFSFVSVRDVTTHISTGVINYNSATGVVTGAGTKFSDQGIIASNWYFYRKSDYKYLGRVNGGLTVTNQALTLQNLGGGTVIMDEEEYLAVNSTQPISPVGWITAAYANRQWYANRGYVGLVPLVDDGRDHTNRIWFSDLNDAEGVDTDPVAGNYIDIVTATDLNTPIKGLAPCFDGLLIFRETDTHLLTGSSPETFSVRKIADDGILDVDAMASWGNSVIWAGRRGIYMYDGAHLQNIGAALGDWYMDIVTAPAVQPPAVAMVVRDTFILDTKRMAGSGHNHIVAINLRTGSCTRLTNPNFQGAVQVPATTAHDATTLYIAWSPDSGDMYVLDGTALFSGLNADAGASLNFPSTVASKPEPLIETGAYLLGDDETLKVLRELEVEWVAPNTAAWSVDVVTEAPIVRVEPGGVTTTLSGLVGTGSWTHAKLRTAIKSTLFRLRFYPTGTSGHGAQIGSWRAGFKALRKGRVP